MENARPLVFRWKSGGKADRGAPAGEHRPFHSARGSSANRGILLTRFVRAFRESLRRSAERNGFRVVHYSIQDDHAHFLVEADDKLCLA
ncbi:MAG: transposase, partial [Gammaproteobacteria bacterium]|nr:transposase [Gammaproteobacteria bacterium]